MNSKTIHLCWFSGDDYPVEIRQCLDSWAEVMPDYTIRRWTYEDARSIGCRFINEALEQRKWAFAADVVRFYAVWKEGGVYMDSDILLYRRFDHLLPEHGCATFNEYVDPNEQQLRLQAAFFMGEKGNEFCRQMFEFYRDRAFIQPDGTMDTTISPYLMGQVGAQFGVQRTEKIQRLPEITVWPTWYLAPSKSYKARPETIGRHCIYGSWRKRSLGRRIELRLKHVFTWLRYHLTK